ncbi:MAG: rhomboid family intramembrane serine protease [Planctomycetes bacterium]|nr:rhomboid family intramembrane serine protease [Planctomycetota bacterium]
MRQIGTLPDAQDARAVADCLAGLSIETRLLQSPGGWELWVCDEDKVPRAREEYQAFLSNPTDERFHRAEASKEAPAPQPAAPVTGRPAAGPQRSLTFLLIAASILVTVLFHSPQEKKVVYKYLFITEIHLLGEPPWDPTLPELRHGELWRLITPAFIHSNQLHILFNMIWLFLLGTQLELRYGIGRFALLVVLMAAPSHLCQYFFSTIVLEGWVPVVTRSSPAFGGMSGVVYGLFGFVWMKAVYEPGCGLYVSPTNIVVMMLWLILCMTGAVGPIGNTAHLVGLAVGMLSGYVSAWWNGFGTVRIPPEPQE